MSAPFPLSNAPQPRRFVYVPAVGPRLRILLHLIFASFALLSASGVYLFAVRVLEWTRGHSYTTQFTLWMFLFHLALGVVMVVPFVVFGLAHYMTARTRPNRVAVRLGVLLLIVSAAVVASGVALMRVDGLPPLPDGTMRWIVYWLHIAAPVVAVWLYVLHRRAGPMIKWRFGIVWGAITAGVIVFMIGMHSHDPRVWHELYSREGQRYFEPSKARTAGLKYIPSHALLMDEYCLKCHQDIYNDHLHSAHKFSSLNNSAYLFSVRETRRRMGERATRWCAGCHDPVPFFSGAFDNPLHDPKFDPNADLGRLKNYLEVEAIMDTKLKGDNYASLFASLLKREQRRDAEFTGDDLKNSVLPILQKHADKLNLDPVRHPIAGAGITCTVCHAMTHVNSRSGNGDYIIEEPVHYPFAYSENPLLQWVNNQLVKARPDFHKKTFLKPFHRSREKFCSTCHHVGIPMEVNHYKEFLQGQNHSDSYHLSGVSGYGVRSFYYPPKAKSCADCHMPLRPSDDFGSRDFDGSGIRKRHDHMFPGANSGVPALLRFPGFKKAIQKQRDFLLGGADGKSPTMRIDLFGLKKLTPEKDGVDAPLIDDQPLRPNLPRLEPGKSYLVEVVVRTLNVGHHFTQGTVDSNEVWVDFQAKAGGKIFARNGGMSQGEDKGSVDEGAHFINVLMLDRHGNRVDRRNAQDIFTPLYNHQIPPGAGQVVHYRLTIPKDIKHPVEFSARVRYRKFDYTYMKLVHGKNVPQLPIIDLCHDTVTLPVNAARGLASANKVPPQKSPIKPAWQRWNDYGIGCFLEGGPAGKMGGELGQAEKAFKKLLGLEFAGTPVAKAHGWLNLARVYYAYGGQQQLDAARDALRNAKANNPPAPWWTVAWYSGLVSMQNGNFDEAIDYFRSIQAAKNQPKERGFDFSKDWVVINKLGEAYYNRSLQEEGAERANYLRLAAEQFERTLAMDAENTEAHDFLHRCYQRLAGHLAFNPKLTGDLSDHELSLRKATNEFPSESPVRQFTIASAVLQKLRDREFSYRPMLLVSIRNHFLKASLQAKDARVRLAVTPVISELDRRLLNALPSLADAMAVGSNIGVRMNAAFVLDEILDQLRRLPRSANVQTAFLKSASLPHSGLPVNLALAGMAEQGKLDGPLPPSRLLDMQALRTKIKPLQSSTNAQISLAAARVLSGIHLNLHGIYKGDDVAEGRAKQIYRQRHPAADRASHAIVIYVVEGEGSRD